ncbi:putative ABC transport system ATP-binding protein [Roseivivax halotolerans]|uniref:Putative ABC transport system ATP-binding protein n=1 Tax=Roseivivax halotolerans TaxID=93684 RepID=A0A1I5ZJR7_9RHOB|nr:MULTISPECIES: ABC transporter ATP-binding protein [Roseivivax]QFT62498.1 putative ABC transporter ATP-binding protein [Roseivivax sp. THAF30]SFQ56357.1 putative ABC transport system ATP-binding protein [Roseivivax halotolerans]
MLSATDIRKGYATREGRIDVLRGVSLEVQPGEAVALTGESGSGKSTLMHCLGCLDSLDAGDVTLAGTRLDGLGEAERAEIRRDRIGVVFQSLNLIPSLDVRQNLAFQARLSGRLDIAWIEELTARLGLEEYLDRYPEELSGGQQQRVAIGRAVANRPELLLADEPTGNLDEETAERVLDLMLDLARETGAAFLMVTHSERHAARMDRQLHLERGRIA